MKSLHQILRDHLYKTCGCPQFAGDYKHEAVPSPEEILKTDWSVEVEAKMTNRLHDWLLKKPERVPKFKKFMQLAKNRIVMGYFRYGSVIKKKKKNVYNRSDSIRKRLDTFDAEDGGNAEHLVDIMNICMMMYIEENHPNFHWKAQDDATHMEKN